MFADLTESATTSVVGPFVRLLGRPTDKEDGASRKDEELSQMVITPPINGFHIA
jgi:hypothetical protein